MRDSDKQRNSRSNEIELLGTNLERLAKEFFIYLGYEVYESDFNELHVDLFAKKDDKTFGVDVKGTFSPEYNGLLLRNELAHKQFDAMNNNGMTLLMMVFALVDKTIKMECEKRFRNVIIWDLGDILYKAYGTPFFEKIISVLPFSVSFADENKGLTSLKEMPIFTHKSKVQTLLQELENCPVGKTGAEDFEKVCFKMLRYALYEDLSLWKTQEKSNQGLFRFDLICRIKDNTQKTFWTMIEQFFSSKYIVFEFKNYNEKITQNEVITTEKYLYEIALRKVAVIIARKGFDKNASWFAKGSLRESGKLILLLTIEDLIEMIKMKEKYDDPSEILLNKVDNMLIGLEK